MESFTKLCNNCHLSIDACTCNKNEKETPETDKEYLETARQIGTYYSDLVHAFAYDSEMNGDISQIDSPVARRLEKLKQTALEVARKRTEILEGGSYDARKVLEQVTKFKSSEVQALLEDESKYRMQVVNGIPQIITDFMFFHKLYGRDATAGAVSAHPRDGISFIIVPDLPDNPRFIEENIPHEVSHIVWRSGGRESLESDEQDRYIKDAFLMYQDELMAKLCSNGAVLGYTHLAMTSQENRDRFKNEHPEVYNVILKEGNEMYDICKEVRGALQEQEVIKKPDLIMCVVEAKNFKELRVNLLKMKEMADRQPKKPKQLKPPEPAGMKGWGSI